MKKEHWMSLFAAPISPVKDPVSGRILKPATVHPHRSVSLHEVAQFITTHPALQQRTLELRQAWEEGDPERFRTLKRETLPYVTPCGTFSYRKCEQLVAPSGLVVVDIDGLEAVDRAMALRDALFEDRYLLPALCFVSPSGRGVKAFVPYEPDSLPDPIRQIPEKIREVMTYVSFVYGDGWTKGAKGVDPSGKDLVRSCFLCHDPEARLRID